MRSTAAKRLLAGVVVGLGLVAAGPAGGALAAAQNGTTHSSSFFFPLGGGGHAPASCTALVALPAAIASDDVNGVQHGTANNNGFWGGETYTGPATLYALNGDGSLGAAQYSGHVTEWDGGGQNSIAGTSQTEFGTTLTFQGTSVTDPSQTLHLHADIHQTTNNAGTVTASTMNISCSS